MWWTENPPKHLLLISIPLTLLIPSIHSLLLSKSPDRSITWFLPLGASRMKYQRSLRKKKQRPLFSPYQIQIMETEFSKQRYITEEKRAHLALKVNLTETQVTTWFQNRRTKWKKDKRNEGKSSPDGKFTTYLGTKFDKFLLPQNLPRFSRWTFWILTRIFSGTNVFKFCQLRFL